MHVVLCLGVCLIALTFWIHYLAALLTPKYASIEKSARTYTLCLFGHIGVLVIMCAIKYGWTRLHEEQRLLKAVLNSVIAVILPTSLTIDGLYFEENSNAIGWLISLNIMMFSGPTFVQLVFNAMDYCGIQDFVAIMLLGIIAHLKNMEKW